MDSMSGILTFALFVLLGLVQVSLTEVHTSSAELLNVFKTEKQAVDVLSDYVAKAEAKLSHVKRYLKEFESLSEGPVTIHQDLEVSFAGNPIIAYQMVKRLALEWKTLQDELNQDDWKTTEEQLNNVRKEATLPEEEDFHGAAHALVRLQDTYNLNMTDLVKELTAMDCLIMGNHALDSTLYSRAVEWFEEAFILAGLEGNQTVQQDSVMESLRKATELHDARLKEGVQYNTFKQPLKERPASEQRTEMLKNHHYRLGPNITGSDDADNFKALCRGEQLLDPKTAAKMKCWLDSERHPYFRLMPVKVEQHSMNPDIYTLHDVISDAEIEKLKDFAKPSFVRSQVVGTDLKKREVSSVRTSKTTWLFEHRDPLLVLLSDRVGRLSGFLSNTSRDDAEALQVVNYGVGGHFSYHYDYLMKHMTQEEQDAIPDSERTKGDRIATFMFYLSDVERGGATAFPRAGVAVTPVKGSAAFWYNLKKSGATDPLTLHGGCPVILGHKWVGNRWIREKAQLFKRPCSLDRDD